MIEPEPLQQFGRTFVRFRGRKLLYFSGCDYFRLASHPKVLAGLKTGVRRYGLNVAASRLTSGNHRLYAELEQQLARFFQAEDALLVANGYVANLVVAQALTGRFSHALLDQESHPSLSDAARFLDCPVLRFEHCSATSVKQAVERCGPAARPILLTDGMFSRDGSAAPLGEYRKVLPRDALLLVDDAHGAGVLGRHGRGTLEHAGVSRNRIIQTLTLSKAFGVFGGAILGTPALRRRILNHSQLFVASTPLPLPLAHAALQAVKLLKNSGRLLHQKLASNCDYFKRGLRQTGRELYDTPGPIVFLAPKTQAERAKMKAALLQAGIYPPYLQYPGGPAGGYFRFVISSEHSRPQLKRLLRALA